MVRRHRRHGRYKILIRDGKLLGKYWWGRGHEAAGFWIARRSVLRCCASQVCMLYRCRMEFNLAVARPCWRSCTNWGFCGHWVVVAYTLTESSYLHIREGSMSHAQGELRCSKSLQDKASSLSFLRSCLLLSRTNRPYLSTGDLLSEKLDRLFGVLSHNCYGNAPELIYIHRPLCMTFATFSYFYGNVSTVCSD